MLHDSSQFNAYIHVVGETATPTSVTMFAVTGAHRRWTTINISETIQNQALDEQLKLIPELMNSYLQQYRGSVPFFGAVTGFVFVRALDHYRFNRDGNVIGRIEEPFVRGVASVSIG